MTILHFLQDKDPASLSCQFLSKVVAGAGNGSASHVILSTTALPAALFHEDVRRYVLPMSLKARNRFKDLVRDIHPDVVHIHAINGISSWLISRWARAMRIPVVVSPYKKLMRWNLSHHYLLCRLPKLLLFERPMLRRASALHAITEQEGMSLITQSLHPLFSSSSPWQENICSIPLNLSDEPFSNQHRIALSAHRLYRKVADSNPFMLMSDTDRSTENLILSYGAAVSENIQQERISVSREQVLQCINSLSDEQWRIIQLHCHDQGVLPVLQTVARRLVPLRQLLEVNSVERFHIEINNVYLETANPHIKKASMGQLADDYSRYPVELKICVMMLNTKHLLFNGQLSRRNLLDLYLTLSYERYNDYLLEEMLQELGMRKFCARILFVLHTSLGLLPGYMPMEMLSDRKARRITKKLFKSNIQ